MTIEQARERVNAATPVPYAQREPRHTVQTSVFFRDDQGEIRCEITCSDAQAACEFYRRASTEYPLALDVIEAAKALCDPECPETPPYWNALHAAIAAFEAATE